mmetsp:Transcript_34327/g.39101  ORF Transcript_34327/g.39101 Transcript_34327/m.39101 type:complete len:160 (+) Transcript_34327:123-602(+)
MFLPIPFIAAFLFAANGSPNTFIIDGCNLMGNKGIPSKREKLINEFLKIGRDRTEVILVFDGRVGFGDETKIDKFNGGALTVVTTKEGFEADDYILQQISGSNESRARNRVIVTADKKLRSLCSSFQYVQLLNPKRFWKRYRKRLLGKKKKPEEYKNAK